MKMKSLPILLALVAVLFHAFHARAFYDARQGRWLSRDPLEELGGKNLTVFCGNSTINFIDRFGLAYNLDPGAGDPHVSPEEHNNYISFAASCPRGRRVTNIRINYSGVQECMWNKIRQRLTVIGDPSGPNVGIGGPTRLTPEQVEQYRQGFFDASAVLGGLRSPTPGTFNNCDGEQVEIQAYMRTRFAGGGLLGDIYRMIFLSPQAEESVDCYRRNTHVRYDCERCCAQAMNPRRSIDWFDDQLDLR